MKTCLDSACILNLGHNLSLVKSHQAFNVDEKCIVTEKHILTVELLKLAVLNICGSSPRANEWARAMCIHSQPPTSPRQKVAFQKKLLKQGLFLFWANFWHPKWWYQNSDVTRASSCVSSAKQQYSVGVKLPMDNSSHVCQSVCICTAAEEDSSGTLQEGEWWELRGRESIWCCLLE